MIPSLRTTPPRFSGMLIQAARNRAGKDRITVILGDFKKFGFADGVIIAKNYREQPDKTDVIVLEDNNEDIQTLTQQLVKDNVLNIAKQTRKILNHLEIEQINHFLRYVVNAHYTKWEHNQPDKFNYQTLFGHNTPHEAHPDKALKEEIDHALNAYDMKRRFILSATGWLETAQYGISFLDSVHLLDGTTLTGHELYKRNKPVTNEVENPPPLASNSLEVS